MRKREEEAGYWTGLRKREGGYSREGTSLYNVDTRAIARVRHTRSERQGHKDAERQRQKRQRLRGEPAFVLEPIFPLAALVPRRFPTLPRGLFVAS